MFKCLSGIWESGNIFLDSTLKRHKVYPYENLLREYEGKFPIRCYILLNGDIIKEVVEK